MGSKGPHHGGRFMGAIVFPIADGNRSGTSFAQERSSTSADTFMQRVSYTL